MSTRSRQPSEASSSGSGTGAIGAAVVGECQSKRTSQVSSEASFHDGELTRSEDVPSSKRASRASSKASASEAAAMSPPLAPASKRASKASSKAGADEAAAIPPPAVPANKRASKASSKASVSDVADSPSMDAPSSKRLSKASSAASHSEMKLTQSQDRPLSKRSSKASSKASFKDVALVQSEDTPPSKRSSQASSNGAFTAAGVAVAGGTSSERSSRTSVTGKENGGSENTRSVETLLLVFIHGFKGSETTTFAEFPRHLADSVQKSYEHLQVRPVIYPTYETRGSLAKAVEAFVDWLTTTCVEMECAQLMLSDADESTGSSSRTGGAGSVKIVLCGHSMGGLVAVDAALEIANSSCGPSRAGKLWPRICGVIAFDTPYCGVHPRVFKNTANKYHGYYQTARSTAEQLTPIVAPVGAALASWFAKGQSNGEQKREATQQRSGTSLWSKTLMATGALALAGGAAAGTYYGGGWTYISDHFLFVSNLWDTSAQRSRLDSLIGLPQVFFHALYNRLPPNDKGQPPRLFIVMPPADTGSGKTAESFEAVDNATASDEIDAHTTMFYTTNTSYERLAQRAAALIVRCLDNEAQYGDQVHAQEAGDLEHGADDDDAYPSERDISLDSQPGQ